MIDIVSAQSVTRGLVSTRPRDGPLAPKLRAVPHPPRCHCLHKKYLTGLCSPHCPKQRAAGWLTSPTNLLAAYRVFQPCKRGCKQRQLTNRAPLSFTAAYLDLIVVKTCLFTTSGRTCVKHLEVKRPCNRCCYITELKPFGAPQWV